MASKSTKPNAKVVEDFPNTALAGWTEIEESLASSSGLSLLLVDGHQPPALAVSNNNSICQAFQSSAELVQLCDLYCGDAHRQAVTANATIQYKCHAGLQCFTQPIALAGRKDLAVIGGRAFISSADYHALSERIRNGEFRLLPESVFTNVIFSDEQHLLTLSARLVKVGHEFLEPVTATLSPTITPDHTVKNQDLQLEIQRLQGELEYRSMLASSLQRFLDRISSDDPDATYESIVSHSQELLQSERVSLFVFDERSNELILKAAVGFSVAPESVANVRAGEGVAGEVIESGTALMVTDLTKEGLTPAAADRLYRTSSFISYPILIRGRRIGLLNLTNKSSGGPYDDVDLSLLEIIEPQVALALERAEWQERATEFQLMSITDPLTGLPNRRYLEERLTEELNRSRRYDYPMSFLMIDIDDFKIYNDTNGHQAGDLALKLTANCLKEALRSADVPCRYGGEEFCILLPQTSIAEAGAIAERIQQRIAATHFPHGKSQPMGRVSLSIGVSSFSPIVSSAETVIAAADRALYRAKKLGKNRVEFYQEEGVETPTTHEQ
jgi:diguanylate cyclase (GGDEF)-like protein